MRRRANLIVIFLFALICLTLIAGFIGRIRETADRMKCVENLRFIAITMHLYHGEFDRLPLASLPNPELPVEKRLSWYVDLYPAYMDGGVLLYLDRNKPWDGSDNNIPMCSLPKHPDADEARRKHTLGDEKLWLCPSNPFRLGPELPGVVHYVGIAGIGADAPLLPRSDPRAGIMRHQDPVSLGYIQSHDGMSNTMLLAETMLDNGPWTAAGRPTVRGLETGGLPNFGPGSQFSSNHVFHTWGLHRPHLCNVAFADCSVRGISSQIDPKLFQALATMNGGEAISETPGTEERP